MMNEIRAIIVDDEALARDLIKHYLSDQKDIKVIAECENGFEGVKSIAEMNPDLVFLDIQMPKLNGFEMLDLLDQIPQVIFITAHQDHAITAFERNAVDYLLKPYGKDRFLDALQKAKDRIASGNKHSRQVEQMIRQPMSGFLERVVVKSGSKIVMIPAAKIHYIESQDDYVMIYTDTGKHLKKGTMKYFEDHLDPALFVRTHRAYIVRMDQVVLIEPYSRDNYVMKLKDGTRLRISRSGYKNIRDKFDF